MTKKDYDLIAACIGASQANYYDMPKELRVIQDLTDRLVLEMSLDNPRFKEITFYQRINYWRKSHSGE